MPPSSPLTILRPADGEVITRRAEREVLILAETPEVAITWSRYAGRQAGPDLHVHHEHTDAFYVLSGELTFLVGAAGEPVRAPAGTYAAVVPGVVHTFTNDGDAESTFLNFHAPASAFGDYLRALRDGTPPSFDAADPPADGGRTPSDIIMSRPGEGERRTVDGRAAVVKPGLPELTVVEWALDDPAQLPDAAGARTRHVFAGDGRVVDVQA
jgi:quercetin dioxygenase-like cupin family protein